MISMEKSSKIVAGKVLEETCCADAYFLHLIRSDKEILHPFLSWSLDSTYMTKDVQKAMLYFTFPYYKAKAFVVWLKIILLSFCKNFMTMVYAYTCVIIHRDTLSHQTGVCAHAHMENSLKSRKNCLDEEN